MTDRSNRPRRTTRPKTDDDRFEQIERALATVSASLEKVVTKKDLTSLAESVTAISSTVERLVNKKSRWAKLAEWFWAERNWSIPTSLGVLAAIGAWVAWITVLWLGPFIDRRIEPVSKGIMALEKRVGYLEGKDGIRAARAVVEDLKTLPVDAIKKHSAQLLEAKRQLSDVKDKRSSDYWSATLGVLRLASIAQSQHIVSLDLKGANHIEKVSGVDFGVGNSHILKGPVSNCTFKDSVIVFEPDIILINDLFINCVFLLPTEIDNPSPQLKGIGQQLLAATNLADVRLTIG
jgi:hypothetical protein